ncbi:hypothetical protein TNCV_3546461 [Trichonephila clavipes]|nr:hypothetical protein TNCV_3546461 [Trichonephila clavipes]
MVPQPAGDLAAVSGRISRQIVYSHLVETGLAEGISHGHHKKGGVFFSVRSRKVLDKVNVIETSTVKETGLAFTPFYGTKIDRFGGKGILMWSYNAEQSYTTVCFRYHNSIEYVWDGLVKAISQRNSAQRIPQEIIVPVLEKWALLP